MINKLCMPAAIGFMNLYRAPLLLLANALLLSASGCGGTKQDTHDDQADPPSTVLSDTPPAHGIRIFPAVDTLPANHLKFYIEFPEPMARGEIFSYFSLFENDSGKPVPEPFREIELWDESARRLTLWFHPGRQKPGVNLNVDIGPILEEGKNYTLVISGDWQTENGHSLGNDIIKKFHAGPMDNNQPDPSSWKYSLPAAGSRDPISISFPEALDYALIPRTIRLQHESTLSISHRHDDRSIRFTPDVPWVKGPVTITIDPKLEDLAGNSIARPFNLDLDSNPASESPVEIQRVFEIK